MCEDEYQTNSDTMQIPDAADEINGLTRKLICYGSNTSFWILYLLSSHSAQNRSFDLDRRGAGDKKCSHI